MLFHLLICNDHFKTSILTYIDGNVLCHIGIELHTWIWILFTWIIIPHSLILSLYFQVRCVSNRQQTVNIKFQLIKPACDKIRKLTIIFRVILGSCTYYHHFLFLYNVLFFPNSWLDFLVRFIVSSAFLAVSTYASV